ncbi:TlpA disulfide reductase family protein [Thalassotalea atypica]|uniref:TlpA disulfide reductase family protein n=1 Tax=Thalassotalea atypica TaxID=2054316 RepID=UPI002573028D|nr:TlpA disulfide reductase family protein [Thalassotalea atypica]
MKNFIKVLIIFSLIIGNTSVANELAQQQLEQHISDNRGKVIYIDFWASWCKPCRKSFPWMNEMKAKYEAQGFVILSVNLDAERQFADEFLAEIPANFKVIYDPKGTTARKLKVKGMPSSYMVNQEGSIVSAHRGFNQKKKVAFEKEIIELLNANKS